MRTRPRAFLEEIPEHLWQEYRRPGFFETTWAGRGRSSELTSAYPSGRAGNGGKAGNSGKVGNRGKQVVGENAAAFAHTPAHNNAQAGGGSGAGQLFVLGDKVFHQKWGEGVVVAAKGKGGDMELTIAFPGNGLKRCSQDMRP